MAQASPYWPVERTSAPQVVPGVVGAATLARGAVRVAVRLESVRAFRSDRPIALSVVGLPPTPGPGSPTARLELRGRSGRNPEHGLDEPGRGARLVLAHYFPPYPVSLDNLPAARDYYQTEYLAPGGEGGQHLAYGGLLRDRPQPRPPRASSAWRLDDLRGEVRAARSHGIDGFTIDVLSLDGDLWQRTLDLARAAQEVGDFTVVPNLDLTSVVATTPPPAVAARLAELYAYTSTQRLDGASLLSSFAAERVPPSWWRALEAALGRDGVPVRLLAVFLDATAPNLRTYAPVAAGFGSWGNRSAEQVRSSPDLARVAHALGRTWMAPVALQDYRPQSGVYAEAGNTDTFRASWQRAREDGADLVQLITWNDYSENTDLAPSVKHGETFLDLVALFAHWYRAGRLAAPAADHVYLTHRTQPWNAPSRTPTTSMEPTLGDSATPPRDEAEALVDLTAPADVVLTSGNRSTTEHVGAGLSVVTVPLAPGRVTAEVLRGGQVVRTVRSPYLVTGTPTVPDLEYVGAGS